MLAQATVFKNKTLHCFRTPKTVSFSDGRPVIRTKIPHPGKRLAAIQQNSSRKGAELRKFTIFKPGDRVTVRNCIDVWLMFSDNRNASRDTAYIVEAVTEAKDSAHAYQQKCRESGCLHRFLHPQFQKLQGLKNYASGYWFDPLVKNSSPKKTFTPTR